jgi:hypothetical protein
MKYVLVACLSVVISGCAQRAENISAAYVSPIIYQNHTCQQLAEEAARLSSRAAQVAGVQDSKATSDAVATGVGVVLFWPALFLIKGDSTTAAELSRLKGEMEAVEKVVLQKKCNIKFERQPAQNS